LQRAIQRIQRVLDRRVLRDQFKHSDKKRVHGRKDRLKT
jgi:hypothetical protein